jgi:L-tyrosine C(3)-methyltransferase
MSSGVVTRNVDLFANDVLSETQLGLLLFGHSAFQYLYAGCEIGVFELLSANPNLSKSELTDLLNLQPQPARCLLLGLTALKLIVKNGDRYRNSLVVEMLFTEGKWEIFHHTVLFEARIVYGGQEDFVESLRKNTNVGIRRIPGKGPDLYHRLAETPALQEVFYNYMGSWSRLSNPLLLGNVDFGEMKNIMDVGGGDATNAIAIATAYPHINITIVDIQASCKIAQKKIDAHGLANRILVEEKNILADAFPAGYDCFLFIHFLVIWPLEINTKLLRKAYDALAPGGRVIIFNSMTSDEQDGPVMGALDTAYFVSIPAEGGMIYSWQDHERCLNDAGFFQVERIPCNAWTPHGIIVATK